MVGFGTINIVGLDPMLKGYNQCCLILFQKEPLVSIIIFLNF